MVVHLLCRIVERRWRREAPPQPTPPLDLGRVAPTQWRSAGKVSLADFARPHTPGAGPAFLGSLPRVLAGESLRAPGSGYPAGRRRAASRFCGDGRSRAEGRPVADPDRPDGEGLRHRHRHERRRRGPRLRAGGGGARLSGGGRGLQAPAAKLARETGESTRPWSGQSGRPGPQRPR